MDWLNLLSVGLGLASFLGGLLLWYRGAVEKQYAAQRDFGHLKRHYEQMGQNLVTLTREFDRRFDDLEADIKDVKSFLNVLITRGSDDSISEILNRNKGN